MRERGGAWELKEIRERTAGSLLPQYIQSVLRDILNFTRIYRDLFTKGI